MRLATIRTGTGTRAVRVDGDTAIDAGASDVGALLARGGLNTPGPANGRTYSLDNIEYAPVVTAPSKIICVGHNYRNHIREMGRDLPDYPTLFPKFADSLVGAKDDILKPPETDALDWEAELAIVIGASIRRASEDDAAAAIAGFTVMNDISMRDWQFRTIEWTQGKIWDSSTPLGPHLVTPDEVGGVRPSLRISTTVNGEVMQQDDTGTLLFDPVFLVRYISTIVRLNPGDVIATGTPNGVGHARNPPTYLVGGDTVVTAVEGIGSCTNRIIKD